MKNNRRDKFLHQHKVEQKKASKTANELYPKFSFEFCFGTKRAINKCDKDTKTKILDKIIFLSQLTWKDISALGKATGFEKMDVVKFDSIPNIPAKFKEYKQVDIFRIPGDKGRLVGYIEDDTFYIVWVDTKLDMYKH